MFENRGLHRAKLDESNQAESKRILAGPAFSGHCGADDRTALIHFLLALSIGPPGLAVFPLLFYLNAPGYLVLLVAYYAPPLFRMRRVIRWTLIFYAALTFALWFVLPIHRDAEGYLDKVLEAALIVQLLIDDRRAAPERRAPAARDQQAS